MLCRCKEEEKDRYRKLLKSSQPLLKKIQEMVEEDISKLDTVRDDDFDNPSWALKQAYKVGLKKGLTMLLEYGILGDVK